MFGAMVITAACFLVGRLAWESKDAADKTENIPVVRVAAQDDGAPRDDDSRDARGDTPPDVQQLLDQYGDPQCSDFETQQQVQAVFEPDQILFGDALGSDINGIACDEFFDNRNPKDRGSKSTLLKAGGLP